MPDPAIVPNHIVTASDLVRRFGYWQDRAARTPVYVMHRGRPRLVLTSVEIMDALCAPHAAGKTGCSPDLAAVLARVEDRVVVADAGRRIVAASVTARTAFGALAERGRALTALVADAAQPQFAAMIDRASRTGVPLTAILPAGLNAAHPLNLLIDTWAGGLIVVVRDAANERADGDALAAAIAATGNTAAARIDTRGILEAASPALAGLRGQPAETLAGIPFAALFDRSSQQAIRDALDSVFVSGSAVQVDALLLAGRSAVRTVRVGFAPRRIGAAVNGITALLVTPSG